MSDLERKRRGRPVKAGPASWSGRQARAMDGVALLRRVVGACLAQILPNAEAIALGSDDPEHVHQLRVGLRRLRSGVRGLQPFAGDLPTGWESAVEPVFEALGEARDRHVLSTTIAPRLREADAAISDFAVSSKRDGVAIGRLVSGAGFQHLLRQLAAFADEQGNAAGGDAGEGLAQLVARLRRLMRQVTRGARHFDELPFDSQHEVRKRLKRLRYLAEFAAPAFERADVKAWLKKVSPAQDALGRHVDLVLAERRFAALAASDPDAWFAVGWLRAKAEDAARAARKSLQRLRDAKTFW